MSIPTHETKRPLVAVYDSDRDAYPGYQRVAESQDMQLLFYASMDELRANTPLERVSALVLDIEGDPRNTIQLQRDLLQLDSCAGVIVTSQDGNSDELVESLGLGSIAVVPRPWSDEQLGYYLKFAHGQYEGQAALDRRLATLSRILTNLTPRQRRVLDLAATGLPNKLIANQIEVSQRTVETERSKLLEAFGAESYSEAMISLGEYRALQQVSELRKQGRLQRLGMFAAAANGDRGNIALHLER